MAYKMTFRSALGRYDLCAGTPFGRTFSDDTVCTDLKMQVLNEVGWMRAKRTGSGQD